MKTLKKNKPFLLNPMEAPLYQMIKKRLKSWRKMQDVKVEWVEDDLTKNNQFDKKDLDNILGLEKKKDTIPDEYSTMTGSAWAYGPSMTAGQILQQSATRLCGPTNGVCPLCGHKHKQNSKNQTLDEILDEEI